MTFAIPQKLVRPHVRELHAYVPGEQPKVKGLIKLNTNENPYPPSPKVLDAVKEAVDGRLRLYPNPTAQLLRENLAKFHHGKPENIIIGNGSDELLALAVRAFVEPLERSTDGLVRFRHWPGRFTVQYLVPSYSLYPVLTEIHGAHKNPVSLGKGFSLPTLGELRRGKHWDFKAALTLVTTPNAPSGCGYSTAELEALCHAQKGVVILDEAYVDFADQNALALALKLPNVIVSRTFSKAYSLCFQRVGYFLAHPEIIAALDKIRDSYNVNGLGQVAAQATLQDIPYYKNNFRKIKATRERLCRELTSLGFVVCPSQTNFLLAKPPRFVAKRWLEELRRQKILVRWFDYPEIKDYLRITVGTDKEAAALLRAVRKILGS